MNVTIALLAAGLATSLHLSDRASIAAPTRAAAPVTSGPFFMKTANSANSKNMIAQAQVNAHKPALPGNPLWSIPLSKLSETRQRPLFTPSRRPPPPVVAPLADRAPLRTPDRQTVPQLALVGTVVGDAEGFGLFIDPATKTLIRLKTGSEYQGWVLRSVGKREVVLKKNDLSATLSLPRHDL